MSKLFRPDGEIVSDALDFEVEGVLSNTVEISMDKQQAWAGEYLENCLVEYVATIISAIEKVYFLYSFFDDVNDISIDQFLHVK